MKKYLKYLLIFIIPILLLNFILIIKFGFSKLYNQFIVEDLSSQYISLMNWFSNVLHGDESLFYSFSKGIGGNMFSTFTYYLSSPLNLILLFFRSENVVIAIYLLINIKIGLSSLTMFIYLRNKFKDSRYINLLLFSIMYSLSGVIVNFYSNIMWLDIYYLTPIVMLGLEKLVDNKRGHIYIISLSIAMISNFYMAYMLCIFICLYFIYLVIIKYSKKDKKIIKSIIKKFILSSLLAALISSVVLVPTIMDMQNMFRYEINKPIFYIDFKAIPMIFSKLFIGSMDVSNMFSHDEANIYICLFSLLLVIFYFFNSKIPKKKKIMGLIVILIFIVSIIFNLFNLIWHGFSFPNGYSYRFVYFYPFFMLSLAYESFLLIYNNKDNKVSINTITKIIKSFIIFVIIASLFINEYEYLNLSRVVISIIFVFLYLIIYVLKNKNFKLIKYGFVILIIMELGINIYYSFISKETINDWYKESFSLQVLRDVPFYIEKVCSKFDLDSLKRSDVSQIISYNDSLICGHMSTNTALSTNHARYYEFLNNSGYSVTYSTILNDYSNGPFIDSILGLEYMLEKEQEYQPYYTFSDQYKIINNEENIAVTLTKYHNPYALNLGYIVSGNSDIIFNNNAFEYQNELAKKMSGLDLNIFERVRTKSVDSSDKNTQLLSFYAEDKYYYIYNYVPTPINTTHFGTLEIENNKVVEYVAGINGIVELEEHVVGKNITVKYTATDEYKDYLDLQVYSFNQDNFKKIINKLKECQFDITKIENNVLEGNIDISSDDSLLMITVPYEKGWNIYVDDKKVEYEEVYDTFVGIRLDKGHHQIKMVFYSPGIVIGSAMSLIGITVLCILAYKDKKNI